MSSKTKSKLSKNVQQGLADAKAGRVYTQNEIEAKLDRGIAKSIVEYEAGKGFGPYDKHRDFLASLHREAKKHRAKK